MYRKFNVLFIIASLAGLAREGIAQEISRGPVGRGPVGRGPVCRGHGQVWRGGPVDARSGGRPGRGTVGRFWCENAANPQRDLREGPIRLATVTKCVQ